jgi:lipoyl(octanoyl) transferase
VFAPTIKQLGIVDYAETLIAMQAYNRSRTVDTPDEIWLLEHPPVYTLGLAGKPEHVLDAKNIPVIKVERGGQVTYHGPGQLVAYLLLDVRRLGIGVKELVRRIEQSLIDLLAQYDIESFRKAGMPGVYVSRIMRPIMAFRSISIWIWSHSRVSILVAMKGWR